MSIQRNRAHKSQLDVYLDTGIHIGRIEQGDTSILLVTYYRLCKYYSIAFEEVLNEIDSVMSSNDKGVIAF